MNAPKQARSANHLPGEEDVMATRLEREIEEIVTKAGDLPEPREKPVRGILKRVHLPILLVAPRFSRWLSPATIGLLGVGFLIAGLVVKSPHLVVGAGALMLGAYLMAILRGGRSFHDTTGFERSWRGQRLDERSPGNSPPRRRWFGKRPDKEG